MSEMSKKELTREEVEEKYTWDLSDLYQDEAEYKSALAGMVKHGDEFVEKYQGHLTDEKTIIEAIKDLEILHGQIERLAHYVSLNLSVDRTNQEHQKRAGEFSAMTSPVIGKLSFFNSELLEQSEEVLNKAKELDPNYAVFIEDILARKPYTLSSETESVLARLSESMEVPYNVYEDAKAMDLTFPNFEANGEKHRLSFVNFEGEYEYVEDTELRRKAFKTFSENLRKYENTIGRAYASQVRNEKIMADIRGFDNVFDSLLLEQKVSRDLYDRQLDVLMTELAPVMRRYVKLIGRVHGIDKMTYADLKLDLDPEFEPSISIEESKDYLYNALGVLGDDYKEMLKSAMEDRWVDFVENKGKSTGAFCAWPGDVHPYVLISWTYKMREVFVLAHELGHAGNNVLTSQKQTLLNRELSRYIVEAPSTMNEMLMANYLLSTNKEDKRFRRWVIASIIARTYYHNFVTHFLEGYYQREVYKKVDQGESLSAQDFSNIFKETLEKFWGGEVELTEGAELTWMRQPHYYMGLYPYTYSAGLTISTAASQRILKEGQPAVEDWRKCLSAGGTLTPVEFAKQAGVDITTDKALRDTVAYISSLVSELEKLTDELEAEKQQ